jgi:outer membrane lipoprotein-sorting protein
MHRLTPILALSFAFPLLAADSLPQVLGKLDASADSFQSMSAKVRKLSHTQVIDDNTEESGTMLLKKLKPRGLQALIDFTKPDPRTIAFGGTKAEIYYPKLKLVQEYDLSKYSDIVAQFLLVGFGTSGKELAANYDIKVSGEESVAGVPTTRLDLFPKTEARREKLKLLQLWIAGGGYPVQQKFLQPSGDYTVFTYSDVKVNPPLTEDALKLRLPKDTKREKP